MSRDVKFDEATFYKDVLQESAGVQVQLFSPREFPEPDWMDTGPVDQNIPEALPIPNAIDIDREEAAPVVPPEAVERVPRRRRKGDDLSIDMHWQPVGGEGTTRSGRHRSQQEEAYCIVHSILYAVPGPSNYREAVAAEDSDCWQKAIADEMKALQHHDVLEPIIGDLPPSNRIVDSKWVFSIKLKVDGSKDKYKARLVARGFSQNPEDYGSITSPIIDTAVIRYTLGHAALHDLEIATLDVPTAYLGATLHEDVFMRLPDADWSGFGLMGSHPCVKLKKSVPGLKQSGRCCAPGLFYSDMLIVNLYVDDLLLVVATRFCAMLCGR